MVALTDEQLLNVQGWINFKLTFIRNKINEARKNPDIRPQARREVRDAMLDIFKLLRTVAVRNGFQLPNTEFTDEELEQKGLKLNQ